VTITQQEAVAQQARRMIGRASAGADNLGITANIHFDIAVASGDGKQRDALGGLLPRDAAVFVTRSAARAIEAGYEIEVVIIPKLPVLHITRNGDVYSE
jgi:hypothetical protein